MAKVFNIEDLKALNKFQPQFGYQRTGVFPLDPSSIFGSKADAELYAAGGEDARGISATRYAGQLIAVQENNSTVLYTVEANDTLKPVVGAVSEGLADITNKVNAILNGESLDSFKDVEDKFAALPKDMVVSGGEVRIPTEAELTADSNLVANEKYIILTIANAEVGKDKLYIKATDLVDVYTGGTYATVSNKNVIDVNITKLEEKLVTDTFAKKADITAITDTLATKEALNAVSAKATANETNITNLTKTVESNTEAIGTKADSATVTELSTTVSDNKSELDEKIATINTNLTGYKVKDVDTAAKSGIALTLSEGKVGLNVTVATLAAALNGSISINAGQVKLSEAIGSYASTSTVQTVLAGLDSRVSSVETKAGSALQSISKGTDGTYVTTTVGEKGSGTTQSVGVAVTIQAVSSASTTAKGLAEASDVKAYVDNKVSSYQLTWTNFA